MLTPLLKTKLYIPHARPGLVPRARLTGRLDAGLERKLILVSAPAGYGKTTLLSEWVSARNRVAWLALDRGDDDAARFLAYLIAALQTVEPDLGQATLALLRSPQLPPIESLLTPLVNEIAGLSACLLVVLDDYHVITAPPVHQVLAFLLDHLPPFPHGLHLVIATRFDPPLPLARLRARDQMVELRAADLLFTSDEAFAFLNERMGLELSNEDVRALEQRTEGWIAGLQLAAIALHSLATPTPGQDAERAGAFIRAFTGSNRHILDYLTEEVMARLPQDLQAFLRRTSILERLSAPLCEAVTGEKDSQSILARLEQSNLFLAPLDDERRWYRYHHLFADFLALRLRQTEPEHIAGLHCRAAAWYEQNGFIAEAVGHALAAEEMAEAARLIEQCAMQMFARSEMATLLTWLDRLPDELTRDRPWLCIFHAWALLVRGRYEALAPRLQEAERTLEKRKLLLDANPPEDALLEIRTMQGHVATLRALEAVSKEQASLARELASQASEHLPKASRVRAVSTMALGWAHRLIGDLEAANQACAEARNISLATGFTFVAVVAACRLAYQQTLQGQLHQALVNYQDALRMATDQDGRRLPAAGYAYVNMGGVYYEWNNLDAALRYVTDGIDLCKQVGHIEDWAIGYVTLARVHLAQGDLRSAGDALQKALQLCQMPVPDFLVLRWVQECQVRLWLAQGHLEAAARWAQASGLGVQDPPGFARELEHIILGRVLVALGQAQPDGTHLDDAVRLLTRLSEAAETRGWMGKAIEILALLALALRAQGQTEKAMAAMARALSLGEPEGYVRTFVDEGAPMERLLRLAAAGGLAADYVSKLLAAIGNEGKSASAPPIENKLALHDLVEPLSERELQVLRLVAAGLSNQEIAQSLVISADTVKTHLKNIYGKLGVHNRTQAAAHARQHDLL